MKRRLENGQIVILKSLKELRGLPGVTEGNGYDGTYYLRYKGVTTAKSELFTESDSYQLKRIVKIRMRNPLTYTFSEQLSPGGLFVPFRKRAHRDFFLPYFEKGDHILVSTNKKFSNPVPRIFAGGFGDIASPKPVYKVFNTETEQQEEYKYAWYYDCPMTITTQKETGRCQVLYQTTT